jgi:hypothetical protein
MISALLTHDILFHGRTVTLQIHGPDIIGVQRGKLTPELLAYLSTHKGEIIAEACRQEYERWQREHPQPGADPRPDLVQDGAQGARLLASAHEQDGEDSTGTWAALHVVRCLGAALVRQDGKWRIERGEYDPQEWADHRARYLAPRTAIIRRLLEAMAQKPAPSVSRSAEVLQKRAKVGESGGLENPQGKMLSLFEQGAAA